MFKWHFLNTSRTHKILRGISLRGPGFVIAFASFVTGVVLYGALASWIDGTRYYAWIKYLVVLPVVLTLAISQALLSFGQRRIAVDVIATLLCLCVLSGIAVALTLGANA